MYADDEHPISLRFQAEHRGGHVHVVVRAGIEGARALCGDLVFRPEDWTVLQRMLRLGVHQWIVDVTPDPVGRMPHSGDVDHLDGTISVLREAVTIEGT